MNIFSLSIYCLLNTVIAVIISTILSIIVKILGINDLISSMPLYTVPLIIVGVGVFFNININACYPLLGFENGRYVIMFAAIFQ